MTSVLHKSVDSATEREKQGTEPRVVCQGGEVWYFCEEAMDPPLERRTGNNARGESALPRARIGAVHYHVKMGLQALLAVFLTR